MEKRENFLIKQLSQEVMEAFREASQKRRFDIEGFSQILSRRPGVMNLINEVCREENKDKKGLSFEELQEKYKQNLDDFRFMENQARELDEAFKKLSMILARLAGETNQPGLTKELASLKNTLRQKSTPKRIASATQSLKNFVLKSDPTAAAVETQTPGEAAPEGIEENIRDILISLVEDIVLLEDQEIKKKARILVRKLKSEFSLEDFKPFIAEIHDLIFLIKEAVRRDKRDIYRFSQEVFSRLEDTEKELVANLDSGSRQIQAEHEFSLRVDGEIRGIEQTFDMAGAGMDQIRDRVFEKIANIRFHLRKKRQQDEARLRQIEEEKLGVEKRLNSVRQRYQQFSSQSRALVEELERIRQASMTDPLTGIYNRRAYDVQIGQALVSLKNRDLVKFSLVVFDVDRFKDFNNNYGHRAGDLTLKHVAKLTQALIRKQDIFARYGGDEFVVILPEAGLLESVRIADKIRSGVNGVEFKIYRDQDLTVRVGLSIGVSEGRQDDTSETVFHRADQALYVAKKRGRNQVASEAEIGR